MNKEAIEKVNAIDVYRGAGEFWEKLTEDEQIQATIMVFDKLTQHAKIRSSFRCLLYDEFGWSAKAYSAIYAAGGMGIHNLLSGAMVEDNDGV